MSILERLEFGENTKYSALEASIHLNRYLAAKQFVAGRTVLDIACGEGYGSSLLALWGAKSVLGVDISEESILKAEKNFGSKLVSFARHSAESILEMVGGKKFELIVSFETVEHVNDPRKFLENIKNLLSIDGVMLVSCPNDYWYYAVGGSNPYHLHRWDFLEFREFSENILGPALWAYGTFGMGFATYSENSNLQTVPELGAQDAMLTFQTVNNALLTPMEVSSAPTLGSVAYFLGIWGSSKPVQTFAGYPVSMDLTKYIQFKTEYVNAIDKALEEKDFLYQAAHARAIALEDVIQSKEQEIEKVRNEVLAVGELKSELRQQGMRNRIMQEENELIRRQLGHMQWVAEEAEKKLSTVPWRVVRTWVKVRPYIPNPIIEVILRLYRIILRGQVR